MHLTVQVTDHSREMQRSIPIERRPSTVSLHIAIDTLVVSTNEHLASFPARALTRAMISTLFGGNELLLSASRRVGNAAERYNAW